MSKKNRRKEMEEQKASEGKVVVLKEKAEEKKEAAEVVKAAEKKVQEPKNELKKASAETMTLDDLAKWSSNQSKVIEGICSNLKKQAECISEHDERIAALEEEVSEMEEYFEEDEEEAEEVEQEELADEPEEEENPPQLCFDPNGTQDGPGYAYKYWVAESNTYGITRDIFAAKQASNGAYDPIWVWYKDGKIDHALSIDELRKYAPK